MLKNMTNSLIKYKRITTTVAKAKALRVYAEPLITKAKDNTTHSRRVVFSYLQDKFSITELFGNIAAKVGDRPGGYLRIIKTGFRRGDAADMAMIEFVDYNEDYVKTEGAATGKTETTGSRKRTRRSGGKKEAADAGAVAAATTTAAAVAATTVVADEVKSEEE
jgi:large subunit ribosomal protein L17